MKKRATENQNPPVSAEGRKSYAVKVTKTNGSVIEYSVYPTFAEANGVATMLQNVGAVGVYVVEVRDA